MLLALIGVMRDGSRPELVQFADWLCDVAAGVQAELWDTAGDHPEGW